MTSHAGRTLRLLSLAVLVGLVQASYASAQSAEGSFERALKVTGPVQLEIRSGSGSIRVEPAQGAEVRIRAKIRSGWSWFSRGNAAERIRRIEQNPPIEQQGNTIRVGDHSNNELFRNVSISYDVTVPAETTLNAKTGSGSVTVGDVQRPVEVSSGSGSITIGRVSAAVVASTGSGGIEVRGAQSLEARSGSGSITADDIAGAVAAKTGSGSVRIGHTGKGDLDVSSSSGEVVVTGVEGSARVSASSGSIVVEGRPAGPWNINSSSGGVTLRVPSDAAFDIDARVGSGRISSDHPVTMSGSVGRQRLQGKVRGGGSLVEVRSSSGGIRIE